MSHSMHNINPILLSDSYKLSHIIFTSKGVKTIYSNFTPRFTHYLEDRFPNFDGKLVWFGLTATLKQVLIESWKENFFLRDKEEVIQEAKDILGPYIGMEDFSHFEDLHDLGYMPIEIKALSEGSLISKGTPCFTIKNTHEDYQWLPNYLESILTVQLWKVMTAATIGRLFKLVSEEYALKTTGSVEGTEFQNHDFSFRGQSSFESGGAAGAAFLISSKGTDNISALQYIRSYYNTDVNKTPVAFSIPAGEHSVTTLGIQINALKYQDQDKSQRLILAEHDYLEEILTKFPTGLVAYVADSYDYFSFLTDILPKAKDSIMARDGKLVVRGDSGDPVDIIAGIKVPDYSDSKDLEEAAYEAFINNLNSDVKTELLVTTFSYKGGFYKSHYNVDYDAEDIFQGWDCRKIEEYTLTPEEKGTIQILYEIFGGTVNDLGYKNLDSHIGMIYGDGITIPRATEIFERLKSKGFSSLNIVFGVGSFSLAFLSRDDLGIAVKATAAEVVNGDSTSLLPIYKDPKTDSSKKSAKGLLKVTKDIDTGEFTLHDNVSYEEECEGELKTVFLNGEFLIEPTFQEIRDRAYP